MTPRLQASSPIPVAAVSALHPRSRAPMASAGSGDARTQGGDKGSALGPTVEAAAPPARRRHQCAEARGEGAENHLKKQGHRGPKDSGKKGGDR
jgi:hypothetical protein